MIPLFKVFMGENVLASLSRVVYSGYIGQGPKVEEFEKALSQYIGNDRVLSLNSGTSALHLALHMIGVNDGEVITTPLTCTATNWPILACGGKPVWCDIDLLDNKTFGIFLRFENNRGNYCEAAGTAILVEVKPVLHGLPFNFLYLHQSRIARKGSSW